MFITLNVYTARALEYDVEYEKVGTEIFDVVEKRINECWYTHTVDYAHTPNWRPRRFNFTCTHTQFGVESRGVICIYSLAFAWK